MKSLCEKNNWKRVDSAPNGDCFFIAFRHAVLEAIVTQGLTQGSPSKLYTICLQWQSTVDKSPAADRANLIELRQCVSDGIRIHVENQHVGVITGISMVLAEKNTNFVWQQELVNTKAAIRSISVAGQWNDDIFDYVPHWVFDELNVVAQYIDTTMFPAPAIVQHVGCFDHDAVINSHASFIQRPTINLIRNKNHWDSVSIVAPAAAP